jgi:hypothetical protein
MALNIDEELTFHASRPDENMDFEQFEDRIGLGFNDHGVRKNQTSSGELESVDVVFQAMEPGPPERRNGVRITDDFLDKVAAKDYSPNPPHLKDHQAEDTFARIGEVRDAWFSDAVGKLMVMTRTPNIEGSSNHQEAIARYTHNPPEIRDGSLGFGKNYEAAMNDDGEPEMKDGKFREFSTVNFPGGYDEGGVNTAFADAIGNSPEFSKHGESESYSYEHSVGDWANRSYSGGTVHMKIRNRTKDSFTVDGNTISGDDGEPVYKGEEYKNGEFTGQMIAAAQSSVSSWSGPKDMSESEAYLAMNFAEDDGDELDTVYSDWSSAVNMTASQLERWGEHPCANEGSVDPQKVRDRNLRLLEKNKSEWTSDDIEDAKRTISFIERMSDEENEPDSPREGGKGTCPSEWAVSLLNWAYNPFSSMPDGDPNPDSEENAVRTEIVNFDDAPNGSQSVENLATSDAVDSEIIQF